MALEPDLGFRHSVRRKSETAFCHFLFLCATGNKAEHRYGREQKCQILTLHGLKARGRSSSLSFSLRDGPAIIAALWGVVVVEEGLLLAPEFPVKNPRSSGDCRLDLDFLHI